MSTFRQKMHDLATVLEERKLELRHDEHGLREAVIRVIREALRATEGEEKK